MNAEIKVQTTRLQMWSSCKENSWERDRGGGKEDETHTVTVDVQSIRTCVNFPLFWAPKSLTLWRSFPRKHTSTMSELQLQRQGFRKGCYKLQRELHKRSMWVVASDAPKKV